MTGSEYVQSSMESRIAAVCQRYANNRTRLMDILLDVQHELKGVEPAAMELIAAQLGITRVEVEGVVSFYSFFSAKTQGDIVVRLCSDIIDRHAGGREVARVFATELGLVVGETSADGRFTLEQTPFLGMSDQAPTVMIGDTIFTRLNVEKVRLLCSRLLPSSTPLARPYAMPPDGSARGADAATAPAALAAGASTNASTSSATSSVSSFAASSATCVRAST